MCTNKKKHPKTINYVNLWGGGGNSANMKKDI